jgi:hypothetical protein
VSKQIRESSTIGETITELHRALSEYIEATYHVSNPQLINQRKRLLNEVGVIHQQPYLESTPRYKTGERFADIKGLDPPVLQIFSAVSSASQGLPVVIHDPPYQHQAASVKGSLVQERSVSYFLFLAGWPVRHSTDLRVLRITQRCALSFFIR